MRFSGEVNANLLRDMDRNPFSGPSLDVGPQRGTKSPRETGNPLAMKSLILNAVAYVAPSGHRTARPATVCTK